MKKPNGKKPKVGDTIYIDTRLFIDHGADDVQGGKATISKVEEGISAGEPTWFVSVEEVPGCSYNYDILMEKQDKLKKEFGRKKAYPDPDYTDYGERW